VVVVVVEYGVHKSSASGCLLRTAEMSPGDPDLVLAEFAESDESTPDDPRRW
jgi:hypothetical protein